MILEITKSLDSDDFFVYQMYVIRDNTRISVISTLNFKKFLVELADYIYKNLTV
jgi:hypothetical protein